MPQNVVDVVIIHEDKQKKSNLADKFCWMYDKIKAIEEHSQTGGV